MLRIVHCWILVHCKYFSIVTNNHHTKGLDAKLRSYTLFFFCPAQLAQRGWQREGRMKNNEFEGSQPLLTPTKTQLNHQFLS